MNKKNINILLPEEEYEVLKLIAQRQYRTVKACVEVITREYIKHNQLEV
jgi:hypothetical protein